VSDRICSVEGCQSQANVPGSAKGFCGKHYHRWRKHGDPLIARARPRVIGVAECAIDGCADLVCARGWCTKHWTRWSRHGDPLVRMPGEIVDGRRICPRCETDKLLVEFGSSRCYCLPCAALRAAEYRVENPYTPVQGNPATCEHCDQDFLADKRRSRYCSRECSAARKDIDNWKHQALRRARMRSAVVEMFDRLEIFERDNWICQLCFNPVDRNAPRHHPRVPSIDHIIPIARGGEHSRANAQTACLGCNVRKGVRVA
jgi:5-methylcytosine-specific restriction endonuclease McrA